MFIRDQGLWKEKGAVDGAIEETKIHCRPNRDSPALFRVLTCHVEASVSLAGTGSGAVTVTVYHNDFKVHLYYSMYQNFIPFYG